MQNKNQFGQLALIAGGLSLALLLLHFYYFCYRAFVEWKMTAALIDRFAIHLPEPLHQKFMSKLIVLLFGSVALLGIDKSPQPCPRTKSIKLTLTGLAFYFGSDAILLLSAQPTTLAVLYITVTTLGMAILYIILHSLIAKLTSFFTSSVFNDANETFPQQEKRLPSAQSIHLKATYKLRNQVRKSIINLDPYAGTLIMGKPGSGKTRYIFRQLIQQSLAHKMGLFVFDLKYPGLTRLTYNTMRSLNANNPNPPNFYSINFDDLSRSHRCNPLDPATLTDISDAAEAARTMLLALNRTWIDRAGDFFCESAISFFTANIWFLREYENGRYCTLPHLIELIQTPYHELFSILRSYPKIETQINSFVVAYEANTMEQLQGQVDSARVPLASLASPQLYYLLSANELTLDINNPQHPKVICLGSNPQKQHIYGAIVSLYISRLLKLVNHDGGIPCHVLADEFTSFYCPVMPQAIAVGRERKLAISLGIQDISQLRAEYGRNQADALFNLPGNILSGRVTGDSARLLAENFPKTLQDRTSTSKNSRDTSTSQSTHLDPAVPPGKIAQLSIGEFVGVTADIPGHVNMLKGVHCKIEIDQKALAREESTWQMHPILRSVTQQDIDSNFEQIKKETKAIVSQRLADMLSHSHLRKLILVKNRPSSGPKRNHP